MQISLRFCSIWKSVLTLSSTGIFGKSSGSMKAVLFCGGLGTRIREYFETIGQRLIVVRHLVENEEVFLANYSDGPSDVPLRNEIFDYIREGEGLVLKPFNRLMAGGHLMAYKYEGFWRAMDTIRDRQVLKDMVEAGNTPWRPLLRPRAGGAS
jgi:hypothetical protein